MTKVAVITPDVVGERMAGPAIRAFELAKALLEEHDVRLVSTSAAPRIDHVGLSTFHGTRSTLRRLEAWADVIFFQGDLLTQHPWLRKSRKVLVADLYDPVHLELLEQNQVHPMFRRMVEQHLSLRTLWLQLERCDFFVCASEKQRDLWLGHLAAVGRLNPLQYDSDPSLRALIDVVPFGLVPEVPTKERQVLRGVVDGIAIKDVVVLWGGGLYPWFDPIGLVEAFSRAVRCCPELKLVFLAGKHPNPDVPEMETPRRTKEAARELGVLGSSVFFIEDWVPYHVRHEYLLESDVGVSTHLHHAETAFSFRTRILDYLWTGLPIISSAGDHMGSLVRERGFGTTVPPADLDQLTEALVAACNPEWRRLCADRIQNERGAFAWGAAARPLGEFCRQPERAVDLAPPTGLFGSNRSVRPTRVSRGDVFRRQLLRVPEVLREGRGCRTVVQKGLTKLSRSMDMLRRPM